MNHVGTLSPEFTERDTYATPISARGPEVIRVVAHDNAARVLNIAPSEPRG